MKKQKNKGISLIVLVITIIVMIILAGSIIISLSNSGIIGKANEAVDKTNLKQIQEMATVLWLDAYSNGARKQSDLEDAVLDGLKDVDTSKYTIKVTTSGVTVTFKGEELPELNEYGFYYDQVYVLEASDGKYGYVFREDGSVEMYVADGAELGTSDMFCIQVFEPGLMAYAKGKIGMDGSIGIVSSDGLSITMGEETAICTFEKVHGIYKGATYAGTSETTENGSTTKTDITFSVGVDNNATITITETVDNVKGETETGNGYVEFVGKNHLGYFDTETSPAICVSLNGEKIATELGVFSLTEKPTDYVEDNTPQLNVYGFYYDQMYVTDWFDEDGTNMKVGYVFHRDGSAEMYVGAETWGDDLFCYQLIEGATYSENQITYTQNSSTITLTVSEAGAVISNGTDKFNYTPMELHGIYRDYGYTGTITEDSQEIEMTVILDINNTITYIKDGSAVGSDTVTALKGREHGMTTSEDLMILVSTDGMKLLVATSNVVILTREDSIYTGSEEDTTSNIIPTGGTYYVGVTSTTTGDYTGATATYTAGEEFPTPTAGDVYVYGDYEYRYNMVPGDSWMTISTYASQEDGYELAEGWGVRVLDTTKTSYATPLSSIAGKNIDSLVHTYAGCTSLTAAPTIPNTVTKLIGTYVGCYGMTGSIIVPNGVTLIGKQTFALCMVTNISLPESVTYIGEQAFFAANNITGMSIPKNVSYIGSTAFSGCGLVTECIVDSANPYYTAVDGVLYTKDMTTLVWYPSGKTDEIFTIPSTVTTISDAAFSVCNFTTINIPDSVTYIGTEAFENCSNITSIIIPNSVTYIGGNAFYSCYGLETAVIGSSVEEIGSRAFSHCDNLTNIYYTGTEEQWANIQIDDLGTYVDVEYNYVP